MKKVDLLINSTTIALAFIGAIVGTWISNRHQDKTWNKETAYYESKALVDKRIELVGDAIKVFNMCEEADLLNDEINVMYDQSGDITNENSMNIIPDKMLFEKRMELNRLKSQFSVTMSLCALFYSDSIESQINKLNANFPWWKIDDNDRNNLINGMYNEVENPNKR